MFASTVAVIARGRGVASPDTGDDGVTEGLGGRRVRNLLAAPAFALGLVLVRQATAVPDAWEATAVGGGS